MDSTSVLKRRFGELLAQAEDVEATKKYEHSDFFEGHRIDDNMLLNWQVKARHLIATACQTSSEHYRQFVDVEKPQSYRDKYQKLLELKAVFLAKAGQYNLLVQKRITALADIRNSAAHGKHDQFGESGIADMIRYIESFLADRL
jgi:hypothetical protein